jgi:hypothetical protein
MALTPAVPAVQGHPPRGGSGRRALDDRGASWHTGMRSREGGHCAEITTLGRVVDVEQAARDVPHSSPGLAGGQRVGRPGGAPRRTGERAQETVGGHHRDQLRRPDSLLHTRPTRSSAPALTNGGGADSGAGLSWPDIDSSDRRGANGRSVRRPTTRWPRWTNAYHSDLDVTALRQLHGWAQRCDVPRHHNVGAEGLEPPTSSL